MGKGVVKLGEGNWAVKDGNLLAAKETNGRFKNAEFTVDRGTDATYVGKDGLIKAASFYNILPYSENFSHWTRTGNTTISATNITSPISSYNATNITGLDGSGGNDLRFFPSNFNSANKTLTFSVYLKGNGTLRMQMSNGVDQGSQDTITLSSNWTRHTFTATFNSTNSGNTFHVNIDDYNGATATFYDIWGAQLVEGTEALDYQYTNGKEGIPRIDFTDNTDGHLLLEPQSTNLITYSEDFSQWTAEANIEVTDNFINSPDGTKNAAKLQLTGSSSGTDGKISFSVSPNATTHTFSVFAKKGNHDYIYIWMNISGGTNITRWIDLDDGSVSVGSGTATVTTTSFSNDWWKIEYTFDATDLSSIRLEVADDGVSTGTGGDNIYVWGAQIEELPYPTSYIPTNGSPVTRDAEIVSRESIDEIDIPQEEGTIYLELEGYEKNTEIFNFDRSTSNSIHVGTDNDGVLKVWGYYEPSGTGASTSAMLNNNTRKVAIAFKNGSFIVYADGEEELNTSTFVWTPTDSIDRLYFNRGGYIASQGLSKVKALRIYKEAFNTTQLDELTS